MSSEVATGTLASGAGEVRSRAGVGRRELMLWLAAALLAHQFLAAWAYPPRTFPPSPAPEGLADLLQSKSVFYYLGWYAVFRLILDASRSARASTGDIALALGVMTLNFMSPPSVAWVTTTACGLYLLLRHRSDGSLAAAGAVLLALAFNGFWGPHIFDLFAYPLALADAAVVGAAVTASQPGTMWSGTIIESSNGHSILIYGPCSSFHNISLGLLCWVALSRLVRTRWAWGDVGVGLLIAATVVALNATRLYLMAGSAESFEYWHSGTGKDLYAWATTLGVLLVSLWGAVRVGRKA